MRTFKCLLLTVGVLSAGHNSALASAPTPTPPHDHKHVSPEKSNISPASATLTAELEKPLSPSGSNQAPLPPIGQDTGGLDDVGDVGGDFEE